MNSDFRVTVGEMITPASNFGACVTLSVRRAFRHRCPPRRSFYYHITPRVPLQRPVAVPKGEPDAVADSVVGAIHRLCNRGIDQ